MQGFSTLDQKLDAKNDALKKYGCDKIFVEKASGKNLERPQLTKLLEGLREKDIVVIYKLDRLGRSLKDLIEIVNLLASKIVDFISISDGIDTSTAIGMLMFHSVGAFAEFERNLISERTILDLQALELQVELVENQKVCQLNHKKKRYVQKHYIMRSSY
ncbi:recombinase family protein [Flavobacterium sp. I-SCBP12n]|uniref:Recombinase family protein n=1 Tax=Flavobacterium pygoscelis TaxID=2893176 RepID=A0A9X1XT07_9FLAO|nr:recombinase family protein [Flavobacterium pygoscelis]MCK8142970.1 recombinase family protein [Flavobacterium pygoscelis]